MEKIQKIFIVLANPPAEDKRGKLVSDLCRKYAEVCQKKDISVDLVDLYKDVEDEEFNPLYYPDSRDTKVVEYQIRIKKADLLVFFYPVWWNSMPAVMKGFVEKVFASGFSHKTVKGKIEGLLEGKFASVFAFDERSKIESKMFHNNSLKFFWERGVFKYSGIKGGVNICSNLRNFDDERYKALENTVIKAADRLNSKKGSVLDLI